MHLKTILSYSTFNENIPYWSRFWNSEIELSDLNLPCRWTRSQNHLVRKRILNHLVLRSGSGNWDRVQVLVSGIWDLGSILVLVSGSGIESSCSHLNFRFPACFEQRVPWHSGNNRVWIHPEKRMWHDKNIQSTLQVSKLKLILIRVILKYTTTHNHQQPPTTIRNHPQPSTTTDKHPQPSTSTQKTTHNHPQPSTTTEILLKKAKACHKQWCYSTLDVHTETDIEFW